MLPTTSGEACVRDEPTAPVPSAPPWDDAGGPADRAEGIRPAPPDHPDDLAPLLRRAAALEADGRAAEALLLLEDATRLSPGAAILAALADRLHARGDLRRAVEAYARALAADPTLADAWWGLGCAEAAQQDHPAAVEAFRTLLALKPGHGPALTNLGRSLFALGEVDEALASFRAALPNLSGEGETIPLLNIATIIPGSPRATPAEILAARRAWGDCLRAGLSTPTPLAPRARTRGRRPLRLGYVSSFFDSRNWMKPVWSLLAHHDRDRFALHVFSDGPAAPAAEYPRAPHDRIHEVSALSNEALARLVRQVEIDLLVDLNGYSRAPRLPLFLLRPAPLQVAWFNLFAPSGLDAAFDYLIGDEHVAPPGEEAWYTEKIARVDGSYLTFAVTYDVPPVAPAPCGAGAPLTFGCLAPLYKITPAVIASWSRILAGSGAARLLLKNELLGKRSVRERVREQFAQHGVEPGRIELEGPAEHYEFLKGYDRIDVALDTFPYNGGTTIMEALWQGVPVLTCAGDRWVARVGTSLLREAGLPEWVAGDHEHYVAQATALAADPRTPARLEALRGSMRDRLRASRACDVAGFARRMEELYLEMWRT